VGYFRTIFDERFARQFEVEAQEQTAMRRMIWPRGRILGGSSSINGLIYIRGQHADYDNWAQLGATGWSYKEVLPYFLRSECFDGPPSAYHGTGGELGVSELRNKDPSCQAWLDAAQEYYVAASATLCAPKSTFTGNFELQPWSIEIVLPCTDESAVEQVDELEMACRLWIRKHAEPTQRGDRSSPSLYDVRKLSGGQRGIKLQGDILYLNGLGDNISWLGRSIEPPGFAHSLLGHLRDKFASVMATVKDRPLFLLNPKTGQREYLQWISKDEPFKYLGIKLTASLNFDFEYQYLLDKLNPLIRQVKAARKIDLAWDVFVAAVNTKIVGLTNYHMGVVPFSRAQSTILNNKVTMALKNTKAASPQQLRCKQPIGVAAPDLSLSAAQIKVQLALNILHSNDQEGQALRWCLRAVQIHSKSRAFPWEDVFLWQSAKQPGFIDAVAQSLQQVGLCIRTDSALFKVNEPSQSLPPSFEQGIDIAAPVAAREAIAQYMNNKRLVSDRSFGGLRRHAAELVKRGLGQHVLTAPRPGLTPISRTPLWESITVDTTETQLAEYTSISDGTGNGVIGTCQLADDACKALVSKLHAGDTAVDAELLGLILFCFVFGKHI
jgi:hypothetical protein